MTNTTTTLINSVKATAIKFSPAMASQAVTPKQAKWLSYAKNLYEISLTPCTTRQEASNQIAKIQLAINKNQLTKRVVAPAKAPVTRIEAVHYVVVMVDDVVSIKSFIGTGKSVQVKAEAKYHSNILLISKDIEIAKTFARNVNVTPVAVENEPLDLSSLTVKQLKELAQSEGISLKGCSIKPLIIAKILSSVA